MNKTRKAIIYSGIVVISAALIFLIISKTVYQAATTATTTTSEDLAVAMNITAADTKSAVEACSIKEVTDPVTGVVSSVAVTSTGEKCTCDEGTPPGGVEGSVTSAKTAAETTAAATGASIDKTLPTVKSDVESGKIASALKTYSSKVYDSQSQAQTELVKVMDQVLLPNVRAEYYTPISKIVLDQTTLTSNKAKSFFNTKYSYDANNWGPQVVFDTNFLKFGNIALSANTEIGQITYNGQSLNLGYAKASFKGTWKIAGDRLYAVAAYGCTVGSATGNTSVTGRLQALGVAWNVPVAIKLGGGKAVKITLTFGYNFADNQYSIPGSNSWAFKP